jgi:hypothetical protein
VIFVALPLSETVEELMDRAEALGLVHVVIMRGPDGLYRGSGIAGSSGKDSNRIWIKLLSCADGESRPEKAS